MTIVQENPRDAITGVELVDRPDGLSAIHRRGCAATIWRRQPIAQFQDWIDALAPDHLPKARTILPANDVHRAVTAICSASTTPDCLERERLIDDIAAMARIFADLFDSPYLRLRLDVVTSNACSKFHIDAVTARLICTYRGTGTQYGISTGAHEPHQVFTLPTGMPIVLRGSLWPEQPRSGLLHRSPERTHHVGVFRPSARAKGTPRSGNGRK